MRETRVPGDGIADAYRRHGAHADGMNGNLPLLSVELLAAVALMVLTGLKKKALSARGRRTCVSCRHRLDDCRCLPRR
jgi:hypothetical protein